MIIRKEHGFSFLREGFFGNLIKEETGKTAQEYIQNKIIDVVKERVFNVDKSIAQIAYEFMV